MSDLRPLAPPSLPLAGGGYQRSWVDHFSNVLRLFFNSVTGTINGLTTSKLDGLDGGWRDMLGNVVSPPTGPAIPVWTQIAVGSPFYSYYFQLNDQLWFTYHIQHDYKPGTDIYLHVHWFTDGTQTNDVKWQMTWTFAKGFNQGAASVFDTTGTVVNVAEAAAGTEFTHMISEITVPISDDLFEVDGLIMMNLKRVTNGGTNVTDKVFVLMSDCHYQTTMFNTKNKAPNFYA